MPERTLEQILDRIECAHEIKNFVNTHAYPTVGNEYNRFWSKKAPDIRTETEVFGVSEAETMRKRAAEPPNPPPPPGADGLPANAGRGGGAHYQTTFVIEMADDGRTAQAICLSPGHVNGAGSLLGKFRPMWSYCRYGFDFIKEDGEWKAWHWHAFTVFNCFYYSKSPVQRSIDRYLQPSAAAPVDNIPRNADRNTSIDAPFSINSPPRLMPTLPVPYASWEEYQSYLPKGAPRDL